MRYALALDVGGTTIKSGIVSENSSISHAGSTPTPANPEKLIETSAQIVADLDALVRSGNAIGENGPIKPEDVVEPIGFDLPGIVDEEAGMAVFSASLGWKDFPAREMLTQRLSRPVGFGHDVRTGALAERAWGVKLKDFYYIAIGTGIATVLVLDGNAVAVSSWAGELGQIRISGWNGQPIALERVCSASGIARRGAALGLIDEAEGAAGVYRLLDEGNAQAAQIVECALTQLARAVAPVVASAGAIPIVIGGGLANRGQQLFDHFHTLISDVLGIVPSPQVLGATLGSNSQLMGAGLRALQLADSQPSPF